MLNPVLRPGDIRAYIPTAACLALVGISIGEDLAGIKGTYAHIGIVAADGLEVAAYGNGVQVGPLNKLPCDILRLDTTESAIAAGLAWAQAKEGKTPYAWWDLPYLWALRLLRVKSAPAYPSSQLICSALGAGFVRAAGLDPWPGLMNSEIAPGDFDGARGLTKVGHWAP